jgi:hypothetical protein
MNPQQGGRSSTDRRPGEGGHGPRGNNQQQALDSPSQAAPTSANGYDAMDAPRQRLLGPAVGESNFANGSLPPSPVDGRSGRSTETSQTLSYRDRSQSRSNGGAGAKTSSGSKRICKKCGELLTGQFVRALGGTFHLDCFRCRVGYDTTFPALCTDECISRIAGR